MAGSGSPPLPNIPYCCLPQESGPCLSTSVGDRPLRSPTHRGLGGPSPRRLPNGTHARPPAPLGFPEQGMPPVRRTAYHPAFPPAVRLRGVGCIRVAHPSATLASPKERLPFDLHVLGLPLAFILSQDQTLRCTIVFLSFFCLMGSAFLSWFLIRDPHYPRGQGPLCAGLKLSKIISATLSLCSTPLPLIAGCKNTTFSVTGNHFFQIFFIIIHNKLIYK